jgi:acetyl-CoA carboxylase biotin carboxylase subunit
MPSPGKIKHITEPLGLGVRHDGYVYEGFEIPIFYDPMISKLIVWASTREEAIMRMKRALYEYKITGVKTNLHFLAKIMKAPAFVSGKYNTHFIEENMDFLMSEGDCDSLCQDMALIAAFVDHYTRKQAAKPGIVQKFSHSPWKDAGRRRSMNGAD